MAPKASKAFASGNYHTGSIADIMQHERPKPSAADLDAATCAVAIHAFRRDMRAAQAQG